MGERRPYSGKFAGLTARTVAELMGCDESTSKRKLHEVIKSLGGIEYLTLKHIGELIYNYREWLRWKVIRRAVSGKINIMD